MSKACLVYGGTGEIKKNIHEMSNYELASKAHEIVWKMWKKEKLFPAALLTMLFELKFRLKKMIPKKEFTLKTFKHFCVKTCKYSPRNDEYSTCQLKDAYCPLFSFLKFLGLEDWILEIGK